jgi:hypothetical protein
MARSQVYYAIKIDIPLPVRSPIGASQLIVRLLSVQRKSDPCQEG